MLSACVLCWYRRLDAGISLAKSIHYGVSQVLLGELLPKLEDIDRKAKKIRVAIKLLGTLIILRTPA